jgi:hypothetical protein
MIVRAHMSNYRHVETFVRFLCDELSIFPEKIVLFTHDEDDGVSGMCIDESDSEFIILVKERDRNAYQIFTTIAHEMVHVRQYMTQELGRLLDEHRDIPYNQRWWENEAYAKSYSLVEKFTKKSHKTVDIHDFHYK